MLSRRHRYKQIKALASAGGCSLCGHRGSIEFDHLDPGRKSFKVSAWYKTSLPESALLSELGKCRALCACCHRVETKRQRVPTRRAAVARRRALNDSEKRRVGSCAMCERAVVSGEEVAFDWDHVDRGSKLGSVSDLIDARRRWSLIAAEIGKCQLLCANCHASKTLSSGDHLGRL